MIIDRAWINKCKPKHGFTLAQFKLLMNLGFEVSWPPSSGWEDKVLTRVITEDQAKEFEQAGKIQEQSKTQDITLELF